MSFRNLSFIVGCFFCAVTLSAQVVPALMNYQGRISESDGNANPSGELNVAVRFWDAAEGGSLVWGPQVFDGVLDQGHGAKVRFEQGFFQFVIGPTDTDGRPLNSAFDVEEIYLELEVEGSLVGRRQRILSAPFALRAGRADESDSSLSAEGLRASDGQAYGWEAVFEDGDPQSGRLKEGLSGAGLGESANALLLDLMRENLEDYPWPVFDQDSLQKYRTQLNRLKDFSGSFWETPEYLELRSRLETESAYERDYQVDYGFLPADRSIQMRWVEPGEFEMGSPGFEVDRGDQEGPVTQVQLTQGFWMSRHEVTQLQWESLMETTLEDQLALTSSGWPPPSEEPTLAGQGFNHPMYFVSYDEAMEFCQRLTANEKEAGRLPNGWHYSLPTEAEWEYVCRAGSVSRFHFGDDIGYLSLGNYDWFEGNAVETQPVGDGVLETQPVGGKLPNSWGFYDMHGNVSEICLDWYSGLPGAKAVDPIGFPGRFVAKVIKGGSYKAAAAWCRSAVRFFFSENARASTHGFRIVLRKDLVEPERSFIVRTVKESNDFGVPPALLNVKDSIEMVWVEPGSYQLGSPADELGRQENESELTQVTISKGFWMSRTEITQQQWDSLMSFDVELQKTLAGKDSLYGLGPNHPMYYVNWNEAGMFCDELNDYWKHRGQALPGWRFDLPTEAEWEYVCRAGTTTRFSFGDDLDQAQIGEFIAYSGSSSETQEVKSKNFNPWGFYGMHGNVAEWCKDNFRANHPGGHLMDPAYLDGDTGKVVRGGSFLSGGNETRSASRRAVEGSERLEGIGFRVVFRRDVAN